MTTNEQLRVSTQDRTGGPLRRVADAVGGDPTGVLGLLLVGFVGLIGSYLLWPLASVPAGAIADVLPSVSCAPDAPRSSGMWTCSLWAGLVRMIGPVVVLAAVFLLRGRLGRAMQRLARQVPAGLRPVLAPLLATGLFLVAWAGSHLGRADEAGIFGQRAFPVVVGLSTYSLMRWGPTLQRRMSGFLDARDRLPLAARIAIVVAFTTLVSVLLTWQDRISQGPLKEQIVVILGLLAAGLLLAPRSDQPAGATTAAADVSPPAPPGPPAPGPPAPGSPAPGSPAPGSPAPGSPAPAPHVQPGGAS